MEDKSYIFKYLLIYAWFNDVYEIRIYDRENDNVVIFDYDTDDEEDFVNEVYTVSKECIENIKKLFTDSILSLNGNDIEFPSVLDGVINKFCIRGNRYNEFNAFNLWSWANRKDEKHPKADMVIKLYENVRHQLELERIDVSHFTLDFPN